MLKKKSELMKKLDINIDGHSYEANSHESVIQVADRNGIYIPRFCYHKKLSIAANCRMCLVEIKGSTRPSPACATPVSNGMEVFTKSLKTLSYQRGAMEFLLLNHPLDCPICDQGGECELQDISMGYGNTLSNYSETKRVLKNLDLGPLISTDMTRCIHCTRCTRFSDEISGDKELGSMGRGDNTEISTYIAKSINSEMSGNMIDLCPVGALTSKPFRFQARAWELQQYPTISGTDCVGTNIYVHIRRNRLMRIIPRENESINETWIADKDRFSYTAIYSNERIMNPMVKKSDSWTETSWEEALKLVKNKIKQVKNIEGINSISALSSDSITNEGLYLIQKIMRQLGSNNIDTRLMQGAHASKLHTGFGFDCSLSEIEEADSVFLVGSYLRKEIPIINHRVLKSVRNNGCKVFAINVKRYDFNYELELIQTEANQMTYVLLSLAKVIAMMNKRILPGSINLLSELNTKMVRFLTPAMLIQVERFASNLISKKKPVMILGFDAILNKDFVKINALFNQIKLLLNAKGGMLSFGANAKGSLLAGAVSEYLPGANENPMKGMSTREILSKKTNLLLTFGIELDKDVFLSKKLSNSLHDITTIIAFSSFSTKEMLRYCDVILPISTHFEEDGSFTNISGEIQHFKSVIPTYGNSKPLWKLLRVLANLLDLNGFDYQSLNEVYQEFATHQKKGNISFKNDGLCNFDLMELVSRNNNILPSLSMYQTTPLLRRAWPLQKTKDAQYSQNFRVSTWYAAKHNLAGLTCVQVNLGSRKYEFNLVVDSALAKNTVVVPLQVAHDFQDLQGSYWYSDAIIKLSKSMNPNI